VDPALAHLLERLDPERTLDQVAACVDAAINCFPLSSTRTETWPEFTTCLERFFLHLHDFALRLGVGFDHGPPGRHWGRCSYALEQLYGPNGASAAFRQACGGTAGGLLGVLRALAEHVVRELADREIAALVAEFLNPLSPAARFAAAREYLKVYGRFLPAELQSGGMPLLVIRLEAALRQHPYLLQRLRRIGR